MLLFIIGIGMCFVISNTGIDLGFQILGCTIILSLTYIAYVVTKLTDAILSINSKILKFIDITISSLEASLKEKKNDEEK